MCLLPLKLPTRSYFCNELNLTSGFLPEMRRLHRATQEEVVVIRSSFVRVNESGCLYAFLLGILCAFRIIKKCLSMADLCVAVGR